MSDLALKLCSLRAEARRNGNFALADEIRKMAEPWVTFKDLDQFYVEDILYDVEAIKKDFNSWDKVCDFWKHEDKYRKTIRHTIGKYPGHSYNYEFNPQFGNHYKERLEAWENKVREWLKTQPERKLLN